MLPYCTCHLVCEICVKQAGQNWQTLFPAEGEVLTFTLVLSELNSFIAMLHELSTSCDFCHLNTDFLIVRNDIINVYKQWFSKYGPQASCISICWKLVR